MAQTRTLRQIAADWLAVRRATRLVVDGWIALAASGVIYVLWSEWAGSPWTERAAPTKVESVIGYTFNGAHLGAWYIGVSLIAVGCARIVADAVRGTCDKSADPGKESDVGSS